MPDDQKENAKKIIAECNVNKSKTYIRINSDHELEFVTKEKFLGMFKNDTKYHSQSNGKSIATYIMGHAICKQYIDSVDVQLNDWPVLENTLYYDAKLIDLKEEE